MTEAIDPKLRKHLDRLAERAAEQGVNLWDALNDAGLLYTVPRHRSAEASGVQKAVNYIDSMSIPQLVPGYTKGEVSGLDMRRGITEQLAWFAVDLQAGRK